MLSVIIPTFNERESICKTIDTVKKILSKVKFEIIVIDDNSPDKTSEVIRKTYAKDKNIYVKKRLAERGLTSAIAKGFDLAKGDYLVCIDADGQHDERKILDMLKQIKNHDLVIGSRYIEGGSISDWSKERNLLTRFSRAMIYPVLNFKLTDPTAGFFMLRKNVFERVKENIKGKGYKILLEIIFLNQRSSFPLKIKEIPYTFKKRYTGESKLSYKVAKNDLSLLVKQYFFHYFRFIKFCIVGFSGVFVNLGLLYFLTERLGLFHLFSAIIAIEASILTNFFLNYFWTWSSRKLTTRFLFIKRLLFFNLFSVITGFLNFVIYFALTEVFRIYYLLSSLISIIFITIINFIVNNKWIFKHGDKR